MKTYAKFLGLGKGMKKIEWILPYCRGRSVLDVGCVGEGENRHLEDNWTHKYISAVSEDCIGMDHNIEKIKLLGALGYQVVIGDAQDFNLNRNFDVILLGEHLQDIKGFLSVLIYI